MSQSEKGLEKELHTPYITQFTIEHVVVPSSQSYEQVAVALDMQLGLPANWDLLSRQLAAEKASWEKTVQETLALIGKSGFTTFAKLELGVLLSLTGKPKRIAQYALGNHLLGVQMIEHIAEVGLYAPLRVVVYEDYEGRTFIAYDKLTSLVSQYQHEEITQMAQLIDHKLEELVMEVTGNKPDGRYI